MRLESVVRPFIPVNSFTRNRAIVTPPPPEPEVGIRWGKPSRFTFSNQGSRGKSGPTKDPDDEDKIKEEVEVIDFIGKSTVYFVQDESQPALGGFLRMTSEIEFTGKRKQERYDERGRRLLPWEIETVFVFKFTLNEDQV